MSVYFTGSKPPGKNQLPTAKPAPASHGDSKRFYKPLFPGQIPSGYEAVGKRPGRAGIGSPVTTRPYWEATRGPGGDAAAQLSAADVVRARQAGTQPSVAMTLLNTAVHPLTDLGAQARGEKPFSVGSVASDVGNIAANFVPVGKAAGILGGLKALKKAKAEIDAAKIVGTAERSRAAAELAKKHGIDIAEVKGSGAAGRVIATDVAKHHVQSLSANAQLREGLKGARSQYGVEKAERKEEMAARAQAADEALRTIQDPHEALAASGSALRGKYAQIDFQGLKELTPDTVKHLMTYAQNHPTLGVYSKRNVMQALNAAVTEGRVPRPNEMRLIEMVFGKKTAAGLVEQARKGWGDKVINALNIPRSLQATADVSGLVRQNLVAGASHPVIWGRNFPKAFKAAASAKTSDAYAEEIKDRALYPMAVQAGVQFTDLGEHAALAAHEEPFASDYATHIPVLGRVIKGSSRAYVTTGNAMKMDLFANRIRLAQAAGQNVHDDKTLKQIAQVVNAATGRGTLPGRAEHLLPAMNTFLFSPRLMLARLHYLDPTWYYRLKGQARREALRGLFATAGGVTSALYLFSRIPGVTVGSLDPRSPDFGKLKVGNTRIDIAAGFQQYVRLAAELATQTEVSSTSGKKTKLGSGFGVPTGWDVLSNFGVNKLAPAPGFGVNVLRGHDAVGNELTWDGLAQNYLTPLTFQDAKDIYNEKHGGVDGITWALGGYGLGSLGVGLQTYKPKQPKTPVKKPASYFGSSRTTGSPYFGSAPSSGGGYFGGP